MAVSAAQISELRDRTGAGIADCKKSLIEADGDMSKATELLRQKGLASASNKASKLASQGAVGTFVNESASVGVILELNSQTDFVAKNEKFQTLLALIGKLALESSYSSLQEFCNLCLPSGEKVTDAISLLTAQIGEKIELRRLQQFKAAAGQIVFHYTHPIGFKIAVMGIIKGGTASLGKDLAMHIAAHQPSPEFIKREEVPQEVFDNEVRIEMGKEDLANKPPQIKEKIVTGRVEKVLLEKVLLEQVFFKDASKKIADLLKENNSEVESFVRYHLGEGIEKKEVSFADEVNAQINSKPAAVKA